MNENTKWFSQTLLTFKDKQYSTEGYLRVALSTNTEDYKFFNPPLFNISISNSNNFQKSINLNIQNAEDLIESFEKILSQLNGNELIIEKHYNKLAKLYFKFAVENNSHTRVVAIEIYSNDSDATKIIVPLKPTFQSFLKRLRFFAQNYDHLCFTLLNKSIDGEYIQIIQRLPSLIKGISSQITSPPLNENTFIEVPITVPESNDVNKTETITYDFDKFLGRDMENITLPEISENIIENKIEEVIVEFNSPLIKDVLKNDIENLESKLNSFAVSSNPVFDLASDLTLQLGFDVMSGINENDKKSISYLSKLLNDYHTKEYTINQTMIPDKLITLKFMGKVTDQTSELAKDILTIIGFMRILRRRLENKFTNPYDNKSLIYMYSRHMMDPICFSFLQKFTNSEIISSISSRFKYFSKLGFFDKYIKVLEDSNCSPITLQDIEAFGEEVYDSLIVKSPFVKDLHDLMHMKDMVKLPSMNTFNLEQIINELVIVEVYEKLGTSFKEAGAINKFKDMGISEEILQLFIKSKKIKKSGDIKFRKVTPLEKLVEKFKQDIPESYREDVLSYVHTLNNNKFDFSSCSWPLIEFDQRIVVAFYLWDPESDSEMATNFNYFVSMVENEQMTKDDILILLKQDTEKPKSFDFENINFE